MRTVPTLCALASGIGTSALGLNLATEHRNAAPPAAAPAPQASQRKQIARTAPPSSHRAMSATVTATYALPPTSSFAFSFSTPERLPTLPAPPFGRSHSENAKSVVQNSFEPRASVGGSGVGRMSGDVSLRPEGSESSRASTPSGRPRSWLRRLSSTVSTSRDSSRTPTSRPASAAVSGVNGHGAASMTGSAAPILPDQTQAALPRNKLVKRSSSVRSVSSSPFQSSGSRLPLPTFRRPATSHQRSVTLQEQLILTPSSAPALYGDDLNEAHDPQWRHYFTPRVAGSDGPALRKRASSNIPNPIKRIYPDRRYTPVLVSGQQPIRQADIEADDEFSTNDEFEAGTAQSSAVSSPVFSQGDFAPRRSFSISDLLSTGPSPLFNRPTSSKSRASSSKLTRSTNRRIVSAPQSTMGSSLSSSRIQSDRPSKRREITNPETSSRSIYSSSSATQASETNVANEIQLNLTAENQYPAASLAIHPTASDQAPSPLLPSAFDQHRTPSATSTSSAQRPLRVSATASELTSTAGSESEYRSIGDASTDYQSDNFFDSLPTRTTRSSSGKRGPPIETIFDESPPTFSSGRSTKLRDFLNTGSFPTSEHSERYRYSTIEEEESVTTPVRSLADKSLTSSPSARAGAYNVFSSSPPVMQEMPDPDEIDWDAPDDAESASSRLGDLPESLDRNHGPYFPFEKSLPLRLGPFAKSNHSSSATSTPQRNGARDRISIFDWSEAQPSPSHNQSPPRPKTVHGKKDPENRGSRPPGRRAPSGMHARSHSVPVVPDVDGKRNTTVANKFGTWGVGSKAVTEDWNEDFDFEEGLSSMLGAAELEDKRIDSGHEMFVPKSIREQQHNVVANIGLLRQWGLLIEELKELRIRAVALGMLNGPYAQAWSEVDAMISLADQETEENTLEPRRSPPSSPGFDFDAFDEPLREAVQAVRARAQSIRAQSPAFAGDDYPSIVFEEPSTPVQAIIARPRKDSEAVARSVIEALQSKRSVSDPTSLQPVQTSKKVPFDTATLRHIVPYVDSLKCKVKDALRKTEGLYTSPRRRSVTDEESFFADDDDDNEPSFLSTFDDPYIRSPSESRRTRALTDHNESQQ